MHAEGRCIAETSPTSGLEGPEHRLRVLPTPGGHLFCIHCGCTHLGCNHVDLLQITPRRCAGGDKGMRSLLPALGPFPCAFPAWEVMHGGYGWLHLHRFHLQKPAFLAAQLWLEPRGVNSVCRGGLGKWLHCVHGGDPGAATKPPGARATGARNNTGNPMATGQGDKSGEWCNTARTRPA